MAANWAAPRSRSDSKTTSRLAASQRAHGARAVTRAAWMDTPAGAIAHHSASGTASFPTTNMPKRALSPQLSLMKAAPFQALYGADASSAADRQLLALDTHTAN